MISILLKKTIFALILLTLLVGCAQQSSANSAAGAIEAYTQALIAKEADRLATLSCAAWEADAKNELDSFAAVTASLKDLKCQESGKDGEMTLVACSGIISASYNGEIQEIDLADRTYQVVNEDSQWRMCGYR